jgi:hypothetical protein
MVGGPRMLERLYKRRKRGPGGRRLNGRMLPIYILIVQFSNIHVNLQSNEVLFVWIYSFALPFGTDRVV